MNIEAEFFTYIKKSLTIYRSCHYRDEKFLLYVRDERGVGKSRVVKTIHLEFCFLKWQKELVITTFIGATIVSVGGTIINGILNIDDCVLK